MRGRVPPSLARVGVISARPLSPALANFAHLYCIANIIPGRGWWSWFVFRRGCTRRGARRASLRCVHPGGLPPACRPRSDAVTAPSAARQSAARHSAATHSAAREPHPGDTYTARHLSVLEGLDAVRKRPGMYIGSTDSRGLLHCLWEIIDNSVDEALGGHGSQVEVVLHAAGSAEVRDEGRGIPVDVEPKTGLAGVELVMTRLHAGGKFGGGSYTASGGLHGVGASVVNALSSRLDIEVDRESRTHATSFRRGVTGEFAEPGRPDADFARKAGLRQIAKVGRTKTGTRIRFWPDRQVFLRDATFSFDGLAERARQPASLVPGLTIAIRAEAGAEASANGDGSAPREAEFR